MCVCVCGVCCLQELVQVTKQKMTDAVKEKIRRLHEDRIITELTKGT